MPNLKIRFVAFIGFIFLQLATPVSAQSVAELIEQTINEKPPQQVMEYRDMGNLFPRLVDLYEHRVYEPYWLDENGSLNQSAQLLVERLKQADNDGLNPKDYLLDYIEAGMAESGIENAVKLELLLSLTTMQFTKDLRSGRVRPHDFGFKLGVVDDPVAYQEFFESIHLGENPALLIDQQQPVIPQYHLLKELLNMWRLLSQSISLDPIEIAKAPRKDQPLSAELARQLGERLQVLALDVPENSGSFDDSWIEAVKSLQIAHGLNADGVIGKNTLAAFNTSWEARIGKVIASMERTRWVPRNPEDERFVVVNVPEFKLRAFSGTSLEQLDEEISVIVGKRFARYRTPIFSGEMSYVVMNPHWNVPYSIYRESILPNLNKPGYLESRNYELVDRFGPGAKVFPPTPENIEKLKKRQLNVRQKPGPNNALGEAKFIFPNSNNVYLHGTPAKQLFSREVRAFSHGCIRVGDVPALANWVLGPEGKTGDWVNNSFESGKNERVILKTKIPVAIVYQTAGLDKHRKVVMYDDIYGHDGLLLKRIGYPYR